jgi:hypothetical protein
MPMHSPHVCCWRMNGLGSSAHNDCRSQQQSRLSKVQNAPFSIRPPFARQTANRATKEYLATLSIRGGERSQAEVCVAVRSGGAMDRRHARSGVFRLCRQLSDRREGRHHHGCRGNPRHPPGRGWRGPNHDRAHRAALRHQARTACWRYGLRFGCQPRLAGQPGQDTPHIPVNDKSKREDGTFSREDFPFDKERNVYICPAGKVLTTTGKLASDGETLYYRPRVRDCRGCPLKPQCCPRRCAESRAASTSRPAMLPGQWQRPKHSSSLAAIESASRCCSPISSAFSSSAGCAYGGQGAPSSSSRWLLSLRTSGGSPSFHRRRHCGRRRLLQQNRHLTDMSIRSPHVRC